MTIHLGTREILLNLTFSFSCLEDARATVARGAFAQLKPVVDPCRPGFGRGGHLHGGPPQIGVATIHQCARPVPSLLHMTYSDAIYKTAAGLLALPGLVISKASDSITELPPISVNSGSQRQSLLTRRECQGRSGTFVQHWKSHFRSKLNIIAGRRWTTSFATMNMQPFWTEESQTVGIR